LVSGYLSFDFGSFRVFLALFCAICGLFTPKVEVSGKGKFLFPALSCFDNLVERKKFPLSGFIIIFSGYYYLTGGFG